MSTISASAVCQRSHTDASSQDYEIPDPPLSELGISQCRDLEVNLKEHLPIAQKTGLIVLSPMRRTVQTAKLGLRWLINRGTPVQLRGEWQGMIAVFNGNSGSSSLLVGLYECIPVDLGSCREF